MLKDSMENQIDLWSSITVKTDILLLKVVCAWETVIRECRWVDLVNERALVNISWSYERRKYKRIIRCTNVPDVDWFMIYNGDIVEARHPWHEKEKTVFYVRWSSKDWYFKCCSPADDGMWRRPSIEDDRNTKFREKCL